MRGARRCDNSGVLNRVFNSIWGRADVFFLPVRRRYWVDLIVLLAGAGLLYSLLEVGQLWYAPRRAAIEIDLSPWALPKYTLFSMMRGILAYFVSLAFTLIVAPEVWPVAASNEDVSSLNSSTASDGGTNPTRRPVPVTGEPSIVYSFCPTPPAVLNEDVPPLSKGRRYSG